MFKYCETDEASAAKHVFHIEKEKKIKPKHTAQSESNGSFKQGSKISNLILHLLKSLPENAKHAVKSKNKQKKSKQRCFAVC